MRKMFEIWVLAFAAIVLLSCKSPMNRNLMEYDRQKVAEVISSHDTTILYFMTSWCQASQSDFKSNLEPYLGQASENKAIVLVFLGEIEEIEDLENNNGNLFCFGHPSSQSFFDKRFINKECGKLLSRYKRVNYVPVRLVCNRKGEILNWNTDEKLDLTYGSLYPFLK